MSPLATHRITGRLHGSDLIRARKQRPAVPISGMRPHPFLQGRRENGTRGPERYPRARRVHTATPGRAAVVAAGETGSRSPTSRRSGWCALPPPGAAAAAPRALWNDPRPNSCAITRAPCTVDAARLAGAFYRRSLRSLLYGMWKERHRVAVEAPR